MKEYKQGNATVRIHGSVNEDKLKDATTKFLKAVEKARKEQKQK